MGLKGILTEYLPSTGIRTDKGAQEATNRLQKKREAHTGNRVQRGTKESANVSYGLLVQSQAPRELKKRVASQDPRSPRAHPECQRPLIVMRVTGPAMSRPVAG